ncbi:MAG: glycosyltransferase [Bacteroidetes bacterium]|nr:glycosyltransferase [Bacteroidota bacterium]
MRTFFGKMLNQLSLKLFKKRISYRHSSLVAKGHGNYFSQKLKQKHYDYIIAPAASGEIAYLQTDIPIIYITDGTFASCLNYHESLSNLTEKSIDEGNLIEQRAIDKSKLVIVSSQWAAESVKKDYKASSQKIKILPYGANFEILPSENELRFEEPKEWKLLFVGVYWENKGGDIALKAHNLLREKGFPVRLTILGCVPPMDIKDEYVRVIPFIDKNDSDGQKKLSEIYREHHLLILPTRFDCTPIVINEASAFGMPCLIADTGGVRGHLENNVNGFLIDYNDKGVGYAMRIEELIKSPAAYVELRKTTRHKYVTELNWEHWTKEFQKLLK